MTTPAGSKIPVVLFLCVHNAGRSQMAAALTDHLAAGRVRVLSGGSAPGETINSRAVQALGERGIDIADRVPRHWTDDDLSAAHVIVTMGCGDECPFVPGKRYEDWDVADPAQADMDGVRNIAADIERRVRTLLISIGVTV